MQIREWLECTKASEVMVRNVLTLRPDDILAKAAAVFMGEQVSGAPVVGTSGACIGVLSVTDLVGAEDKVALERETVASSSLFNSGLALPMSVYEEKLAQVRDKIAPTAEQPVSRFMTSDIVSVQGDTPLSVVVHDMVNAHIHRVVVLDSEQRLLGIICTTDVLAALLRADG